MRYDITNAVGGQCTVVGRERSEVAEGKEQEASGVCGFSSYLNEYKK